MSSLMSKVTSLKEAIDKLEVNKDSTESKILSQVNDILFDIVEKINEIEYNQAEVNEYVTVLDENLGNLEDELYGFEEEDEEFNSYDYIDVCCDGCSEVLAIEKSLVDNENKILCPNCGNFINLKSNKDR
ncbi:CD1247 N-terminal domain-containing protein [Clostridium ganghwense]|uniref:Zinc ribbon domain-containing protein n=1 Tax=Clostridium ganghwense TaxID=312089 RepID=A0ABT4CMP2_9CLOT|nr:CD1247 N-terminal domain-containing protein [Clostridium ganghwense]MCY6370325.1 hypothetical protein [Clostridium ganghwense]